MFNGFNLKSTHSQRQNKLSNETNDKIQARDNKLEEISDEVNNTPEQDLQVRPDQNSKSREPISDNDKNKKCCLLL